ncbi:Mannitol-1-phosphate dehydrogenase [Mycena venus]|uniref:alcohol dehydrogenase n=1 Tax=Mycena venus TaxID=2733690 RepID=A0A8H6Y778_9AGAR|nr:Mannitol-1-phosphate dehydrogenase [Mycena venus]
MTSSIPLKARAAVITSFDQDLALKDDQPVLQPSQLAPGECLVKIDYAGVCHSDLHIKEGGWGPVKFPIIGGHEGIGHIVAIGEHTVGSPVKIGDRVGVKWIANACLKYSGFCAVKDNSLTVSAARCVGSAPKLRYTHITRIQSGRLVCGLRSASHPYLPSLDHFKLLIQLSYVNYCTPIPEKLDSAAATPLLCAGLTIYKALKESKPQLGHWVAIPGAGGGLGIQYAVAMGLRVIAIDTGDAKRDLCLKLGAEKWVDFKTSSNLIQDVKEAADGKGPHSAVVVSSNPGPLDQAVMYLRPKGTLVAVGIPSGGAVFTVPIALLIAKCLTIIGSAIGNRQDMAEALDIAATGKVTCHHEVKPFSEVNAVFADLAAQKIAGRVVLKM